MAEHDVVKSADVEPGAQVLPGSAPEVELPFVRSGAQVGGVLVHWAMLALTLVPQSLPAVP